MKANKDTAVKKFTEEKYNCCQAVVCSYCEELGVKEEDVFRMTEGFGLGMGGLKDTCGAVTGMFLVLGLENSAGDMKNPLVTKADTYQKVRKLAEKFEKECGSIYCRELKGFETGTVLASCPKCVETAAACLDAYFAEQGK